MADWVTKKLKDVISEIDEGGYVLTVIQRKLVWTENQMILLFNSLFRKYSFGSIIAFEEKKDSEPLFSFRKFTIDGNQQVSNEPKKLDKKHFFNYRWSATSANFLYWSLRLNKWKRIIF